MKEKRRNIPDAIANHICNLYDREEYVVNPTAYIYDLAAIRRNIRELERTMPPQVKLYYAMKANPHESVMSCIRQSTFTSGVEIASAGELEYALRWYSPEKIIFTGPGKTDYELEQAIRHQIRFINIESIAEAVRINRIAKQLGIGCIEVLIRINLNYCVMDGAESMSGCSTKMGIDENAYWESYRMISELENIQVKGIHVFAASGILDSQSLLKVDQYIFELVKRIEETSGKIDVIDFGGGLGIDYTDANQIFDVDHYGYELAKMIAQHNLQDKEMIMELGTYLVGDAGYYTARIVDIKETKGKKHIIIAGGVNHMGLPLEMQRKHPVAVIPMNEPKVYPEQPGVHGELADISGPLCMVSDKLSWDEYIEDAEIGDIVVYRQAGAYCYGEGMHSFLMHKMPHIVIMDCYEEAMA